MEVPCRAACSGLRREVANGLDDDETFRNRLRAGDRKAFQELFRRAGGMVFSLVLRLVHDRELSEDLTQEVFLKVYQALPGYQGRSSLSTWIYRIAYNTALSEMEKARYRYETGNVNDLRNEASITTGGDDPEDDLMEARDRNKALEELNSMIEALKPEQRAAITLY